MRRRTPPLLLLGLLVACGSNPSSTADSTDGTSPREVRGEPQPTDIMDLRVPETLDSAAELETSPDVPWVFDAENYPPVHGWILLDDNPDVVAATIELAAKRGVNHIQLSHSLIMNVEDILGGDEAAAARVATLNMAIELSHQHDMKVFIWAHEFSGTGFEVCFDPADPVWQARGDAYRQAFALLPGLDGVILMFGSAPAPPWFSLCMCDWCLDNYDGLPLSIPPAEERISMVVEHLGEVIVNESGKELFVRTFVHEPAEIAWHNDGLAAAKGVAFVGMHKGPVQDWQPYNPHHPSIGHVGDHASVVELDLAGEYFGQAILPWCAPGYYWYRLNHLWQNKGIGVVSRVQRGANSAIGTPNEVNLLAVQRLLENHQASLADIWAEFIESFYGLTVESPGYAALQEILADTFPIRRKSHYALGIWALEKSSDFPDSLALDEFNDRGKMPKWNSDWQAVWDALDKPDKTTVLWLWQEGSEAVELAAQSLDRFKTVQPHLSPEAAKDLERRLIHQWLAARAWRAMDLFIWSHRVKIDEPMVIFDEKAGWMAWARDELVTVKAAMEEAGLAGVGVASPERIGQFLGSVPAGDKPALAPEGLRFSPVRFTYQDGVGYRATFATNYETQVVVNVGTDLPDYAYAQNVLSPGNGNSVTITLENIVPGQRNVVRLRAAFDGIDYRGGDFWLFAQD
jgi:hypothetical protein